MDLLIIPGFFGSSAIICFFYKLFLKVNLQKTIVSHINKENTWDTDFTVTKGDAGSGCIRSRLRSSMILSEGVLIISGMRT